MKVCYETEWSPSGIYCCADSDDCTASEDQVPQCVANTTQCDRKLGGGCCAEGTTCSPEGCLIKVDWSTSFAGQIVGQGESSLDGSDATAASVNANLRVQERVSTTSGKPTYTGVKFGEVGVVESNGCHEVSMLRGSTMALVFAITVPLFTLNS